MKINSLKIKLARAKLNRETNNAELNMNSYKKVQEKLINKTNVEYHTLNNNNFSKMEKILR